MAFVASNRTSRLWSSSTGFRARKILALCGKMRWVSNDVNMPRHCNAPIRTFCKAMTSMLCSRCCMMKPDADSLLASGLSTCSSSPGFCLCARATRIDYHVRLEADEHRQARYEVTDVWRKRVLGVMQQIVDGVERGQPQRRLVVNVQWLQQQRYDLQQISEWALCRRDKCSPATVLFCMGQHT